MPYVGQFKYSEQSEKPLFGQIMNHMIHLYFQYNEVFDDNVGNLVAKIKQDICRSVASNVPENGQVDLKTTYHSASLPEVRTAENLKILLKYMLLNSFGQFPVRLTVKYIGDNKIFKTQYCKIQSLKVVINCLAHNFTYENQIKCASKGATVEGLESIGQEIKDLKILNTEYINSDIESLGMDFSFIPQWI